MPSTASNIVPFNFELQEVRVVMVDGEPLFVAKDVVESLDARWDGNKTIQHVPEMWKRMVGSVPTASGLKEVVALTEHGVYFYLNRSDKPKALPAQLWIAGEVLPSIRKTGGYQMGGTDRSPIPPITYTNKDGSEMTKTQVRVTTKGLARLGKELSPEAAA